MASRSNYGSSTWGVDGSLNHAHCGVADPDDGTQLMGHWLVDGPLMGGRQ